MEVPDLRRRLGEGSIIKPRTGKRNGKEAEPLQIKDELTSRESLQGDILMKPTESIFERRRDACATFLLRVVMSHLF
jgi:hypothetical protein